MQALQPQSTREADIKDPQAVKEDLDYFFEQFKGAKFVGWMQSLIGLKYEVTDYLDDIGDNVDQFLGDDTLQIERSGSVFKLYVPLTYYDRGVIQSSPRFRAYIDMPRTKKRMRLLISSFDETDLDNADNTLNTTPNLGEEGLNNDSGTSIAAQYLLDSRQNSLFQFDLGARISSLKLNPYVQLRFRHKSKFENGLIGRSTQTLLYERIRHLVWEMRQDFDYQTASNELLRSETRGTWLIEDQLYQIRQRGIVFFQINPHRVRSYFAEGYVDYDGQAFVPQQVALGMNWREKLYQDWLFAEIEPRLSRFAEDDFQKTQFSIRLMLEMHFHKH
ncbi:hypothetical protein THMIRHAS_24650 [Thiosulfatimonas sediminis]|uniref:Uncharacterized protein n=1 Tax=Thiosulfatimonas sediminis TaxID=2675054 RepID=A0A6F8PY67_9GAMM|nr:hypothetical protein [Thiosulfatimonas sediminis]BBP47092.1 hypothetical protein THMIRHAS_24650 [Thiosulfatimonas sediminis]